jgi:hypothetical protein
VQNHELQELQALSGKAASSRQGGSHSTRVVDSLRVQLNSTTSSFKSVLEVRRDALQAGEQRRHLFASSVAPAGARARPSLLARPLGGHAAVGHVASARLCSTAAQL